MYEQCWYSMRISMLFKVHLMIVGDLYMPGVERGKQGVPLPQGRWRSFCCTARFAPCPGS